MAKDRTICEYYECFGKCSKGKEADYKGYCQHCKSWKGRKGAKLVNKKRESKYKYYE